MIRREMQLPGKAPQWLLISQVEHARLSGLLGEHCLQHFPAAPRAELLQAITHHDDGWAEWESRPRLDVEHHRPFSFFELPLEESLPIWSASIAAVANLGLLAGATVAGHFLALLDASHKQPTPEAVRWREQTASKREMWLAAWQLLDPAQHTTALADDALRWLQFLDVLSLWLCGSCPVWGEVPRKAPSHYLGCEGSPLETEFRGNNGQACMEPWRLAVTALSLEAVGWIAPLREYHRAEELLAARKASTVRWQLGIPAVE